MCAAEFGGRDGGMSAEPGVAAAVTKAAGKRNMLLLTAGALAPTSVKTSGMAVQCNPSSLQSSGSYNASHLLTSRT